MNEDFLIFVPTVPVLHTVRTAGGSFFKIVHNINDNIPPLSLTDAHLGGFFFSEALLISSMANV